MRFKITSVEMVKNSGMVDQITASLNSLPNGDLLTLPALARRIKQFSFETVRNHGHLVPKEYFVRDGNKKFYGSPKTVKAYKAKIEAEAAAEGKRIQFQD